MPTVQVHYEQAVYGSFPFWDRGYAMLAHSAGCHERWLSDFRVACQRLGERPSGISESAGLFALRLESGPWAIVGIGPQGVDDRGRPGALAFHALFIDPREYRKAGASPFGFAGLLRNDWTAETTSLGSGTASVEVMGPPLPLSAQPVDDRVVQIASALASGRRVALQSPGPIDVLADQVWQRLPVPVRSRLSLATWAFGNGNRFDLVALPRLAGIALDNTYLDPSTIDVESGPLAALSSRPHIPTLLRNRSLAWAVSILGVMAILVVAGLAGVMGRDNGQATPADDHTVAPVPPTPSPPIVDIPRPPDRSTYRESPTDLDDRRRVLEALVDMADRFAVLDAKPDGNSPPEDPAILMTQIAEHLRYRGPRLSPDEVTRLATDPTVDSKHDRDLALAWHAKASRFVDDRPLPDDFSPGPLRWQLDTLAWSFHLDDDPEWSRRSTPELPHALAEALAVDIPLRRSPLVAQYPALASYLDFLGKLPRR